MDIKEGKKNIESKYLELLEFQKKGVFPHNSFIIDIYELVHDLCTKGDSNADELYELHTFLIKNNIKDSINILNNIEEKDFTNDFCKELDKLNYIIIFSNGVFSYLENYYIKSKNRFSLNKKSFDLLKNDFFIPFKEKLFQNLKINDENNLDNNKKENDNNIKKILNMLLYIDILEPKIEKINNEIIWIDENKDLNKHEIQESTFDNWFNNYFIKFIEPFVQKEIKELQNLSISEYISSFFKLKLVPYYLQKF